MTRRKIIFPDPDYWTRKDTMTVTAGDYRRGGALLRHHIDRNCAGVNVILEEAVSAGRATNLVVALLETLDAVAQQLLTGVGLRGFDEWIHAYAMPDFGDYPDTWRRAARLIAAHGLKEHAEMSAIINDTADDNATPVILTTIDVYAAVMPVLTTQIGTELLDAGIRTLAGMEAEGNQ